MTLTIGSLFAGIGGFDLGFERAGFKTIWQCEIDKAAQGVLRRHFPDATLHSDVCQVGAHNLEPVDVVTYGSPCQDLSISGKRAGLAGERSGLFHEAARVIRELREQYGKPDFAIWENVPGAFSSNEGRDFAAVVQAMVDIGARDICWRILDSRYFGVAQRRRRVFLVADFGGERAEQILFEPESLRGDIAKGRKARKDPSTRIRAGAKGGGREWPAKLSCTLNTAFGTKMGLEDQHALSGASLFVPTQPIPFDTTQITSPYNYSSPKAGDPCHPLAAGAHPPAVAFPIISDADRASSSALTPSPDAEGRVRLRDPGLGIGTDGDPMFTLQATKPHAVAFAQPIAFHPTQDPISSEDGSIHAITSRSRQGCATVAICATVERTHALTTRSAAEEDGTGPGTPITVQPPMQVRRLTPTECERLQGFPDGWTAEAITPDGKAKQQADGPRYKQLGNAVTVNVAEWIARRVAATLAP